MEMAQTLAESIEKRPVLYRTMGRRPEHVRSRSAGRASFPDGTDFGRRTRVGNGVGNAFGYSPISKQTKLKRKVVVRKFTGDTPRFASPTLFDVVPASGEFTLDVAAVPGGDVKSPSQTGLLLMYRNAEGKSRKDVGKDEAQAIEIKK